MKTPEISEKGATPIKNIERIERPREKLIRYGVDRLTDAELLAIVLRSGKQGQNVVALATQILETCGLADLAKRTIKELQRIPAIGPAKACEIIACCELGKRAAQPSLSGTLLAPKDVWMAVSDIYSQKKEHFVALYLNSRQQLMGKETISIGTVNASLVHPREVFEPAIRMLACQVIAVHNHPSGDVRPSAEDIEITERLKKSGHLLGVELIDHVVVTDQSWWSMREHGWRNSE